MLYSSAVILNILGYDHISYRMIDISAVFTIIAVYVVAIFVSLQGYRPAKFYLLAWTVFFAGLILFILRNVGLLPYNNFTNYTMQTGVALEVVLL